MAADEGSSAGLGSNLASSASIPIHSSNIGFQLLKKQGWKEGTGLGVSEQGRLEPIETTLKKNKRGLGAEKAKKAIKKSKHKDDDDDDDEDGGTELPKNKVKGVSKKIRKIQEFETKMQEKEFDRDFFRMFWPDNV